MLPALHHICILVQLTLKWLPTITTLFLLLCTCTDDPQVAAYNNNFMLLLCTCTTDPQVAAYNNHFMLLLCTCTTDPQVAAYNNYFITVYVIVVYYCTDHCIGIIQ